MHTTAAAVELLIRGSNGPFADSGNPWIEPNDTGGHWINFETMPEQTGALSSGERTYLHIAAFIGLGGTDGPTVTWWGQPSLDKFTSQTAKAVA